MTTDPLPAPAPTDSVQAGPIIYDENATATARMSVRDPANGTVREMTFRLRTPDTGEFLEIWQAVEDSEVTEAELAEAYAVPDGAPELSKLAKARRKNRLQFAKTVAFVRFQFEMLAVPIDGSPPFAEAVPPGREPVWFGSSLVGSELFAFWQVGRPLDLGSLALQKMMSTTETDPSTE